MVPWKTNHGNEDFPFMNPWLPFPWCFSTFMVEVAHKQQILVLKEEDEKSSDKDEEENDSNEESESGDDENDEKRIQDLGEVKSTFEERQIRLRKKIEKLEDEAIAEKSWEIKVCTNTTRSGQKKVLKVWSWISLRN